PPEMYLKAIPLRTYEDVDIIKSEVRAGNIVITNVSPLAKRSIEDVKRAISELSEYMTLLEGDIARLGEERVVLTPKNVKIWRGEAKKEG
ncbi:cell division protein SepF, partial [Candidatus Bathyarchaeota archaeon]|nr:cell division protein SepF [Candidatus Bathyarchaeota archaeon]